MLLAHQSKARSSIGRLVRCTRCLGLKYVETSSYRRQPISRQYSLQLQRDEAIEDYEEGDLKFAAFPEALPKSERNVKVSGSRIQLIDQSAQPYVLFRPPSLEKNKKGPKKLWVKRRSDGEVLALYDACLQTQNWERSMALLKQIRAQTDDEVTLRALNRYLQAVLEDTTSPNSFERARDHFFEYLPSFDVRPNKVAYALLCRAALRLADDAEKERLIDSMVGNWLQDHTDFGEILSVTEVLTLAEAQELFSVSKLDYRAIGPEHRSRILPQDHPLKGVTEIKPTIQKGIGLTVLKRSLDAMTNPDVHITMDKDQYRAGGEKLAFNLARQKVIEENAIEAAVLRWKHEHDDLKKRGGLSYKKSLNSMFWEWKEEMVPLILEELARIDHRAPDKQVPRSPKGRRYKYKREQDLPQFELPRTEKEADYEVLTKSLESADSQRSRRDYGPFLGLLKPDKLAAVTILEVIRSLTTETLDGLKAASLAVKIGKAIEDEYHSEILKKKSNAELFNINYQEALQSGRVFNMAVRKAQSQAIKTQNSGLFQPGWTQSVRAQVGAVMMSFLIHAARLTLSKTDENGTLHTQEVPAFFHTYQYAKGQKLGVVKVNEEMVSRLSSEPLRGSIYPRLLPMLTPPRPWYSHNSGGYLYSRTNAMRSKNSAEQLQYLKSASDRGYLDNVLAGLDVLGQTPWKINQRVFECAVIGWNSGEAIADIPPAEFHLVNDLPEPPAPNADPSEKFEYMAKLKEASAVTRNFASMRSDLNYKLEIARAFLNDVMYFPHSLDFRGRAYPIPPHFNHLGNDLCRGLLKFGDEKELGVSGLRWLKIHLANQCGYDKASFEERESFADANIEKIFEACDNPMDGTRWWLSVDKPWQCLAACIELTSALRSPVPTEFKSALPVHQDGTCNGLQHYAALGGDMHGAQAVNLKPSDRPQDVYRGVAEIVQAEIDKDALDGVPDAKALQGKVTRKVVKQTVMTNVYGVTYIGARQQVENQLLDMDVFKNDDVWHLSSYIVLKIFKALKTMFTGAHEIQEWLKVSAQLITRSVHVDSLLSSIQDPMTSVIWTSPLDLPIVQPYRKEVRRQVYTNLQTVFLSDPTDSAEVNSRKQAAAFPPNFIHSLDATHMLMSALVCRQQGITFAAVHDSYWTHAADTDTMNVILRDAFIKLHSEDLMKALAAEFAKRYAGHYSPNHHILRTQPAYAYAIKQEHLDQGKVKILQKNRGVIITDPELAQKVLLFNSRELKGEKKRSRAQVEKDLEALEAQELRSESDMSEDRDESDTESTTGDASPAEDLATAPASTQTRKAGKEKRSDTRSMTAWAIWTPIKFPELPKKGDFDVSQLRTSKYFFS